MTEITEKTMTTQIIESCWDNPIANITFENLDQIQKYHDEGWYWSIGSSHEFKWQCRFWKFNPNKDGSINPKNKLCYTGHGDNLNDAITSSITKLSNGEF